MHRRFTEVREKLDFKKSEFAEELGIKSFNIRDIESGKQKIPIELAEMMEEKFSISGWWLLTGKGEMFIVNNKSSSVNVNNSNNVAVNNGNGTITINTKDYVDSNEIKELLELLKDTPKSWIHNIIERLKKSLNAIDNDFK
ncbi:helix-turn-helix domain-containing protein [Aliarcobacter cryaerophilus]|uniref:helix-turn-helix domain-containing protein n=1 Tax=Aliarcobacter cryaerophilus TaxID=28198 RepID=UPI0021B5ED4B|nr:helix-turn-helix transcriptional regulator [Aliarcobacter cryaerophilus]MCT7524500.1 helix-turn-helix domain-containing protein [Aliarcobacter cryaerophilus]